MAKPLNKALDASHSAFISLDTALDALEDCLSVEHTRSAKGLINDARKLVAEAYNKLTDYASNRR